LKLPRDLGGEELAQLLGRYGYQVMRQRGGHMRLTSAIKGYEHRVTIPRHKPLRVGTLNKILKEIAAYLEMGYQELVEDLFQKRR
jgi:predicted RNA binding protein YcfA (HicA-like mRNA interferase family)